MGKAVKVVVGRKYRFVMKSGGDRWGTVLQVLIDDAGRPGTYVIELAKPVVVAGYSFARGAECLIERRCVERVAEVL